MQPLRRWSRSQVLLAGAAWILVALVALYSGRESMLRRALAKAQRDEAAATAAQGAALAPGARLAVLPPERDDIYIVLSRGMLAAMAGFFLGPPVLLLLAWDILRRRHDASRS